MTSISRRAWATIDLSALKKNLAQVRAYSPCSKIYPVIKSNAYGHGMAEAAAALKASNTNISGLAVATVDEAIRLRQIEAELPILLLNGFMNEEELRECLARRIEAVVHADYQLGALEKVLAEEVLGDARKFWIKYNTGMNRLGLGKRQASEFYLRLRKSPNTELVLMSHLACADDPDSKEFASFTQQQLQYLTELRGELVTASKQDVECSMAASAGILQWPDTHLDYVRPGVMLYGSSPLAGETGEELGLQPVMTLRSRLITIRDLKAGESIGYGATYVCDRDTRMGTVSIGYGDGYPRSAINGTPVLVQTASGSVRTRMIGRVSMDMITIDLTGIDDAQIDDEVTLWGEGLCADEVARAAGTISYELFCKVTPRVEVSYSE
jgi:alanine racemase